MSWKKMPVIAIPAIALACGTCGVAQANLVLNGGFESTTDFNGNTDVGIGQMGFNINATDWTDGPAIGNTTDGYNFLFAPGTADTTFATSQYGAHDLGLWGPNDGSANGLPATSPDGGNFVAADGDYGQGPISQTISGLTSGDTYVISFDWAAAQQQGFTGPSTEQWQVSFGSQTQSTAIVGIPSEGFSGWMSQSFSFTADGSSDVLSFLALGTPSGVPTFALLDGVSASSVPLPTALSLGFVSMIGLAAARMRKHAKAATV